MALPDYEAWALFAAVADHGSFRAAASASGVSVPTVSKAVARLEDALGVALFHRTSRRVTLTVAGERLADRARAIVASGAAAEEAAGADAGHLAGPVRMTAPMSLGLACLGEPLAEFCAAHPAVTIDVMLSDARCDLVGEGIDIALRIAEMQDSSLLSQTIAPIETLLLASPEYIALFGMPAHPDELPRHRLLGYGHEQRAAPIRLSGPGDERAVATPTGPVFTNNGDLMLPLLIAGQGIGMLPRFIAGAALDRGELVPVLTGWSTPGLTLNLVTPPSRLRPARVTALVQHLVGTLKGHPLFG